AAGGLRCQRREVSVSAVVWGGPVLRDQRESVRASDALSAGERCRGESPAEFGIRGTGDPKYPGVELGIDSQPCQAGRGTAESGRTRFDIGATCAAGESRGGIYGSSRGAGANR